MWFEKFFNFFTFRRSRIGIQNLANFNIVCHHHRKWRHQSTNRICNRWTACPATTHIRVPRKRQNFSRKILSQKRGSQILKILRIYGRAKLSLIRKKRSRRPSPEQQSNRKNGRNFHNNILRNFGENRTKTDDEKNSLHEHEHTNPFLWFAISLPHRNILRHPERQISKHWRGDSNPKNQC